MILQVCLWETERAASPERVTGFVQASFHVGLKKIDVVSPLATV